jgi:indole-3-glycerol phosphate synthase
LSFSRTGTILDEILAAKEKDLVQRKKLVSASLLEDQARNAQAPRSFLKALKARSQKGYAVIAELKRASPSRGIIREDFDPVMLARDYESAGAAAVSVLTEENFFHGRLEHLSAVRKAVKIPLLCKDFIIDTCQVYEARAAGADAVLIIVAALSDSRLSELYSAVASLGMTAFLEVHDERDLARALRLKPELIGINNRDLKSFEVDIETTVSLLPRITEGIVKVSESGFSEASQLRRLSRRGVHAFLIGETLLRAPDPGKKLKELLKSDKE